MKTNMAKAILLGILFLVVCAGPAGAWLITHVCQGSYNNFSTPFDNSYMGYYYTKGIAPASGTITTWAVRSGINYGQMTNSNGQARCRRIYLWADGINTTFNTVCGATSGTGYGYMWDKDAIEIPFCPVYLPD